VALVGRRRDRVEEVAHEIGDSAFAIPADISRTSEIEGLLDQTVRRFGRLNFLLNNAGVLHIGNAEQITEEGAFFDQESSHLERSASHYLRLNLSAARRLLRV